MKQISVGKTNDCSLYAVEDGENLIPSSIEMATIEIKYDKRAYPGVADIDTYIVGLAIEELNKKKEEEKVEVKAEVKRRKRKPFKRELENEPTEESESEGSCYTTDTEGYLS